MKNISIDGIIIAEIPSSWNEFSSKQISVFCSLLHTSMSLEAFKLSFFMHLTGLKIKYSDPVSIDGQLHHRVYHKKTKIRLLSTEDLLYCLESLDFLFNTTENDSIIESRLFKNILPSITVNGVRLFGPNDALFNISIAEFIRTEILYEQFLKSENPADLDKLCAVLYRRKDPTNHPSDPRFTGDVRIPFNDHLVDDHCYLTKHMKDSHKTYIRLFYEGCRFYIFRGSNQFNYAFSDSYESSGKNSFLEFMKLITALTLDDVTKAESVRTSLLFDVLFQLDAIAEQQHKLKNNV